MNNLTLPGELRYSEINRPQTHFSPPRNWMNDPNGLVYYDGVYHLFYQYNPADKVWDDMHWGHATSSDLIRWTHKPVALFPDAEGLGYVFSGGAVVDWKNSSGLGSKSTPPLVAQFTHSSVSGHQVQSLAYSADQGESWVMYAGNPIIENPGIADFRDPKVIWDDRSNQWIMVVAAGDRIKFYRSINLIDWEFLQDFGEGIGAHGGCWECPDLFPLTTKNQNIQKWVLLVSLNPGGPNGGSATQYFVGDFDGDNFRQEHSDTLWLDYGPDHYAGITWSGLSPINGRRILIAWMSNWQYANHVPTDPWRGAMTVPRELSLIETGQGLRVAAKPVSEYDQLRVGQQFILENTLIESDKLLCQGATVHDSLDIEIEVELDALQGDWILKICNEHDEQLEINCRVTGGEIEVRRDRAAFDMPPEGDFVRAIKAPLDLNGRQNLSLRILKDRSSLEIFTGEGVALITALFFTHRPLNQIKIELPDGDQLRLIKAVINELESIWD
ncbi:MAG: glycoside hydrolase family 32 protein [Gammaproteobacteria bacterium]|nr:glycoside hydrolase family 32 protein [Gammaproteobacteria bacterium]